MSKSYIDRAKVVDGINDLFWDSQHDWEPWEVITLCHDMIAKIPDEDVRPVVLCKDCQNSYEWANVDGDNYRYCGYLRSRWNHDADRMVDDDDFCKWGRKREES